ncbi:MAG TPA: SIS domain-containing protein [Metabacillus sp.]|nr:SIS domain-containing protein [Metabacillus sp.]
MLTNYFEKIQEKLQLVLAQERKTMEAVAEKIANTIQSNGIIHLFGCGHSHILSEEMFYRAGGLVPVKPMLIEELMLHKGAVKSSYLERQNDYAEGFMNDQDIQPQDLVIVISTSGINPVPIDVALHAKNQEAYVVGISSFYYVDGQASRHNSGRFLSEVVDLALNNHVKKGDAALTYEHSPTPFGPTSTVIGAVMLNAIFAEATKIMINNGFEAPVFLSGNIDGADEHNQRLIEKYSNRIPLLKFE